MRPLFSVYGIEIEYMIVHRLSLEVMPIADKILEALCGTLSSDYEEGPIAVSNELALHVIELKTNGPTASLTTTAADFHAMVQRINTLLAPYNACLMPSGAHPFFDPREQFALWPHGDRTIYETYDRLFGCSGHGWTNLQSTHLNLPFATEQEFVQLHSAIRLLLPLLPALAASTPFIEHNKTGMINSRLHYYGKNQTRCPIISGEIIPEPIRSIEDYQQHILTPMYAAIRTIESSGLLEYEWLNSRGAIARFDRSAIEIRVLDTQECPLADIALVEFISLILKKLTPHPEEALSIDQSTLVTLYQDCIQLGSRTPIHNAAYLQILEVDSHTQTAQGVWTALFNALKPELSPPTQAVINIILQYGNLSERLLTAYDASNDLTHLYQQLVYCLNENSVFVP